MMPKHDHTAILQTVRQELPPEELVRRISAEKARAFGSLQGVRRYHPHADSVFAV